MQNIELVGGHLIDDLEQRRLAEEVAPEIDEQATPTEARCVADVDSRNNAGAAGLGGDELT